MTYKLSSKERQEEFEALNKLNRVRQLITQLNSDLHGIDNLLLYLQAAGIDTQKTKVSLGTVVQQVKEISNKEEQAYAARSKDSLSKNKNTWR